VLAALSCAPSLAEVRRLPPDLPGLWDALAAESNSSSDTDRVLLLDDVDLILSSAEDGYQQALLESIGRLLREGRASGTHLVLTAQRVSGALQSLAALCGSTVVLRMPNQQEHVLAGGSVADFREDAAPGGGTWRGHRMQAFEAPSSQPPAAPLAATDVDFERASLAVVSTQPQQLADRMRTLAPDRSIIVLGSLRADARPAQLEPAPILVADPESWQAHWSALASALRAGDVLFDGCSSAELRTLAHIRQVPPPFPRGERPRWLLSPDGALSRARLPTTRSAEQLT
jgi:S-DNA-T family DNA segregation ATPase FtsK/SpoIIIE